MRSLEDVRTDPKIRGLGIEEVGKNGACVLLHAIHIDCEAARALHRSDMIPDSGLRDRRAEHRVGGVKAAVSGRAASETEPEAVVALLEEPPAVGVHAACGHLVHDRHVSAERVEEHPRLHGEFACRDLEIRCVSGVDVAISTIHHKGLSHLARRERHPAVQNAIVTADDVVRVSLTRPPAHQAGGRRHARSYRDRDRGALHRRPE